MNSIISPTPDELLWNHWFVGFCDGEASFTFRCDQATRSARPRFKLCLQQDAELIQAVFSRFGSIGSARGEFTPKTPRAGSSTAYAARSEWDLQSVSGCRRLVGFFQRYPPRSHKCSEFTIWSELVAAAEAPRPDRRAMNLIAWRLNENRVSGNSNKARITLKGWLGL